MTWKLQQQENLLDIYSQWVHLFISLRRITLNQSIKQKLENHLFNDGKRKQHSIPTRISDTSIRSTSGLIAISFRLVFNPLPGTKLKTRERGRENMHLP